MGLIPKTYILHIVKNESENILSDNQTFRELCASENIEIVQAPNSHDEFGIYGYILQIKRLILKNMNPNSSP